MKDGGKTKNTKWTKGSGCHFYKSSLLDSVPESTSKGPTHLCFVGFVLGLVKENKVSLTITCTTLIFFVFPRFPRTFKLTVAPREMAEEKEGRFREVSRCFTHVWQMHGAATNETMSLAMQAKGWPASGQDGVLQHGGVWGILMIAEVLCMLL